MGTRCGLKIVQSCSPSFAHIGEIFCDPLASRLKVVDIISPPVVHAKGAVLFMEGQTARGIFAVCTGQVRLSKSSLEGKAIIVKIASAGELLGFPATLSGKPYEVTAKISEQTQINFIARAAFLRFLSMNPKAVIQVAQLLTSSHYACHERIRSLGLSHSASERLARLLLDWSANHAHGQDSLRITLTHEEIGEIIGTSRKTVTRSLTAFKKRNLLTVKGGTMGGTVSICNRAELQNLAGIYLPESLPLPEPAKAAVNVL